MRDNRPLIDSPEGAGYLPIPAQAADDVRHSRHAVKSWEAKVDELILAVGAALEACPSNDPCNDEPFALQADGYHYWRLRHAFEALEIDGLSRLGEGTGRGTTPTLSAGVPNPMVPEPGQHFDGEE